MSIKTTQTITRDQAVARLLIEIVQLPNETLAGLLDTIADSDHGVTCSRFDNFVVLG